MEDISIILICLISFPFILFILRIIILSWKYFLLSRQLKAMEQQSARQQNEGGYINTNSSLNLNDTDSSCHMGAKGTDVPPAYDDVMQPSNSYPKQQNCASVSAAVSTNDISNCIATITIENTTDVAGTSDSAATTAPSTSETNKDIVGGSEKSNDHIV